MLFVFKRIILEERLYYDQKGGRALRIVVASAETLFAPLNCLPLLRFCLSSFFPPVLLFPLFLSFFPHIFPPHFFSLFFPTVTLFVLLNRLSLLKFCFSPSFFLFFLSFFNSRCQVGYFSTSFLSPLFSAVTLIAPLNCLPLLKFCFSSFSSYFLLSCSCLSFLKFVGANPPFVISVPLKEPQLHFASFFL